MQQSSNGHLDQAVLETDGLHDARLAQELDRRGDNLDRVNVGTADVHKILSDRGSGPQRVTEGERFGLWEVDEILVHLVVGFKRTGSISCHLDYGFMPLGGLLEA